MEIDAYMTGGFCSFLVIRDGKQIRRKNDGGRSWCEDEVGSGRGAIVRGSVP